MSELSLMDRDENRGASLEKLNDSPSPMYSFGYELIVTDMRRSSDPGPESREPWTLNPIPEDTWVPSLPPRPLIIPGSNNSISDPLAVSPQLISIETIPCNNCTDLLKCLKKRFIGLETHTEKILLLTTVPEHLVPDDSLAEEFGCPQTLAYTAITLRQTFGPFFCGPPQFIQHMPKFVKTSILEFFSEQDNSGEVKGPGHGVFDMIKPVNRAMFVSLAELFQEYIFIYPFNRRTVTYSRFANLVPNTVIWSKPYYGNGQEETCIIHENFQLLLSSCYHFYSEGVPRVLNELVCSTANAICMLGYCDRCPLPKKVSQLTADYGVEEKVEFHTWQPLQFPDSAATVGEARESLTFIKIIEPIPVFNERLSGAIRQFLRHHFIFTEQDYYWQKMIRRLSQDLSLALVKMDFCESFTCVSKVGPKSSKLISYDPQRAVAFHPFHVKYYDDENDKVGDRTFVVVSNDLRETPTTSFLFRMELIQWMKRTLPQIKTLVYWSDDNPGNFKNSKNIINLMFHEEDFKIGAKHEFTVEGHAAQECSEVVTMIKRICRRACLKGEVVIADADDMWKYCSRELAAVSSAGGLEFGYVDRRVERVRSVELRLERRYQVNHGIVPGIEQFYSFRPDYNKSVRGLEDTIRVRRLSSSEEYQVIKMRLSGRCEGEDFVWHSVVSEIYSCDWYKLQVGNIVTFSVEGVLLVGKISEDVDLMKGKLRVMLMGRVEKIKGGRRIGQANFEQGKFVDISSLDVVLVESSDAAPGTSWRQAGRGGWGGGTRRLLGGFGKRMLGGGGSFKL